MIVEDKYPDFGSIRALCKKRVPEFVFDYFDSSTGNELNKIIDRKGFDCEIIRPDILQGDYKPNLKKNLMGEIYDFPFGIAPVGMSGMVWGNAERILIQHAVENNIPYVLSTVATKSVEDLASCANNTSWFQLYCPKDDFILKDILNRAWSCGFKKLVVTVDLPAASVRERQLKSGLTIPPKLSLRHLSQISKRPAWLFSMLLNGPISMPMLDNYGVTNSLSSTKHIGYKIRTNPDIEYIKKIRDMWEGKLIIKGIQNTNSLNKIEAAAVDALWVSNHAGRQFQSGEPSIEMLKNIRPHTRLPIIFDSGIQSGLDIIKAYNCGADFVMLGKFWHFSIGAFGIEGAKIAHAILVRDIIANMYQIGMKGFVTE